jgi:hypothetical protein
MSQSFTYAQIVQICEWLMASGAAWEARPAADLTLPNTWEVQTRAGYAQPWQAYDTSGINMVTVEQYLFSIAGSNQSRPQPYGPDNPVGLSASELQQILLYLTVAGGFKFARLDGDRVLTSPDGIAWSVFSTSTEMNFPAMTAAVKAIRGF